MASVRISRETMQDMKKAAEEKFLLSDPKPTNKTELTDQILKAAREMPFYKKAVEFLQSAEVVKLRQSISSSSFKTAADTFGAPANCQEVYVIGLKDSKGQPMHFSTSLAVPATMFFVQGYNRRLDIHIDQIDEPNKQMLIDAINQSTADVQAWQERYNEYTSRVNTLFNACKTTGQLLDAWPAAEVFIPKTVVAKMQQKTTNTADLDAKAKREAFKSEGLDEHILIAGILSDVSGNKGNT